MSFETGQTEFCGSTGPIDEAGPAAYPPLLLLFSSRGFASRLIRWQTRSEFSHAAIWLPRHSAALPLDGDLYEALQGRGVISRPVHQLDLPLLGCVAFEVPAADPVLLRRFLDQQLGKRYDWSSVVRFVTRKQAKREAAEVWFCSELAFAALAKAGAWLFRATEPWEVSPGMLPRSPLCRPFPLEIEEDEL